MAWFKPRFASRTQHFREPTQFRVLGRFRLVELRWIEFELFVARISHQRSTLELTINRDRAIFHYEFIRLHDGILQTGEPAFNATVLGNGIREGCGGELEYEPSLFGYFHEDGRGFRNRSIGCGYRADLTFA